MADANYLSNVGAQAAATAVAAGNSPGKNAADYYLEARQQGISQQANQANQAYLNRIAGVQEQAQRFSQYTAGYKDLLALADQTIQAGQAANRTPAQISSLVNPITSLMDQYEARMSSIGIPVNVGSGRARVDAMLGGPSLTEQAQATGQAKGTAQSAQINALAPVAGKEMATAAATGVDPRIYSSISGFGTLNEVTGKATPNEGMQTQALTEVALRKPQTINTGEGWQNAAYKEGIAKQQSELATKANSMYEAANAMQQVSALLKGQEQDMFSKLKTIVQSYGNSIGVDIGLLSDTDLTNRQLAEKVRDKAALAFVEQMKGNLSDSDREFVRGLPANIYDTAAGRQLLTVIYNLAASNASRTQMAGAEVIGKYQRAQSAYPPPQDEYDYALNTARQHPDVLVQDAGVQDLVNKATTEAAAAKQPENTTQSQEQPTATPSNAAADALKAWKLKTGR